MVVEKYTQSSSRRNSSARSSNSLRRRHILDCGLASGLGSGLASSGGFVLQTNPQTASQFLQASSSCRHASCRSSGVIVRIGGGLGAHSARFPSQMPDSRISSWSLLLSPNTMENKSGTHRSTSNMMTGKKKMNMVASRVPMIDISLAKFFCDGFVFTGNDGDGWAVLFVEHLNELYRVHARRNCPLEPDCRPRTPWLRPWAYRPDCLGSCIPW